MTSTHSTSSFTAVNDEFAHLDLNNKIVIKAEYRGVFRKMPLHNEELTFNELQLMLQRIFKLAPTDVMVIKYKDEDSDLITITDDNDLSFAIQCNRYLRLKITSGDDQDTGKSLNELPNLVALRSQLRVLQTNVVSAIDLIDSKVPSQPTVQQQQQPAPTQTGTGSMNVPDEAVSQEIRAMDPLTLNNEQDDTHSIRSDSSFAKSRMSSAPVMNLSSTQSIVEGSHDRPHSTVSEASVNNNSAVQNGGGPGSLDLPSPMNDQQQSEQQPRPPPQSSGPPTQSYPVVQPPSLSGPLTSPFRPRMAHQQMAGPPSSGSPGSMQFPPGPPHQWSGGSHFQPPPPPQFHPGQQQQQFDQSQQGPPKNMSGGPVSTPPTNPGQFGPPQPSPQQQQQQQPPFGPPPPPQSQQFGGPPQGPPQFGAPPQGPPQQQLRAGPPQGPPQFNVPPTQAPPKQFGAPPKIFGMIPPGPQQQQQQPPQQFAPPPPPQQFQHPSQQQPRLVPSQFTVPQTNPLQFDAGGHRAPPMSRPPQ